MYNAEIVKKNYGKNWNKIWTHIQKNYKEIYEMKGEDAEMKCEN